MDLADTAPVLRVTLASTSRSADAGHLSAADIAGIAADADVEFRLVGGNAVSLLVWVHGVAALVPARETNDADLGVPALTTGAESLVEAMVRGGYGQTPGGCRSARRRSGRGSPRSCWPSAGCSTRRTARGSTSSSRERT